MQQPPMPAPGPGGPPDPEAMMALESMLGGQPDDGTAVECQVCGTTVDTVTGAPLDELDPQVEAELGGVPLPVGPGAAPPPMPM